MTAVETEHPTFEPGDYIVGKDIPEDVAQNAVWTSAAIIIPEPDERETKLA